MNTIKYIILFLFAIWIISVIAYFIIFNSNRLYCFIYEHKAWKLWDKICKHLQEAKFIRYYTDDNADTIIYFQFKLTVDSIDYDIIYWCKENTVSVHHKNKCLLSDFDKYHSNKAAKIIKHYYPSL